MRKSEKRKYTSAKEWAQKQAQGFTAPYLKLPEGVKLFKPKSGIMLLDIIPFKAGEGNPNAEEGSFHWERSIWVHRGIGANNDSFLCLRKTSNKPCPVCEFRSKLMKTADGDEEKEKMAAEMAPKHRQLFNVFNRKDPDKGVQVWDMSYHLFGKVLQVRLRDADEDDGWESFFFAEGGLTLKIGFGERSYGGAGFFEADTIDFKRRDDLDEDILEAAVPLDDIVVETPYDKLKKHLLEADEDEDDEPKKKKKPSKDDADDDDDEEEDKPVKKKKPADDDDDADDDDEPVKKKKKPADDDDDDDDDDDEEEDKPHIKTKKQIDDEDEEDSKAKKKKSKSDDDDDDWDDFDEDEEDEPKKKKK